MKMRIERDSMGEVQVPEEALYQAQTQRARDNFQLQPRRLVPLPVVRALLDIKAQAARVNAKEGKLQLAQAEAIVQARTWLNEQGDSELRANFPLTVFQTGSGTSSNMNANEVLATLASRFLGQTVHPNDHVNCSQSSNDVFPSALQIAVVRQVQTRLYPSSESLAECLEILAAEHGGAVKTGRTHLMDAMPITFGQVFKTWQGQLRAAQGRVEQAVAQLKCLPLGGTAVGTGVNASSHFASQVVRGLTAEDDIAWQCLAEPALHMSGQEAGLALASALKSMAVVLTRISNDLRWMNSGPIAGLQEVQLPALQPGSSIMPAKVNPVIPEAVLMAMMDVMGNEQAVLLAAQSGNFELNVTLPLIADKLLASIDLVADSCALLKNKALQDLRINTEYCRHLAERNPILVTALNERVGYENAAKIAKKALKEGKTVLDVALEEGVMKRDELENLLDPMRLADRKSLE